MNHTMEGALMSCVKKVLSLDNVHAYYVLVDNQGKVIEPAFRYAQFLCEIVGEPERS